MAALHLAFVKAVEKLPPQQLPQQSVSPSSDPFACSSRSIIPHRSNCFDDLSLSCSGVPLLSQNARWARLLHGPYLAKALVGTLASTSFTSISAFAPKVSCLSMKEPCTSLDMFCRTKNLKLHLCRSPRLSFSNWATALVYLAKLCNNRCCKETIYQKRSAQKKRR